MWCTEEGKSLSYSPPFFNSPFFFTSCISRYLAMSRFNFFISRCIERIVLRISANIFFRDTMRFSTRICFWVRMVFRLFNSWAFYYILFFFRTHHTHPPPPRKKNGEEERERKLVCSLYFFCCFFPAQVKKMVGGLVFTAWEKFLTPFVKRMEGQRKEGRENQKPFPPLDRYHSPAAQVRFGPWSIGVEVLRKIQIWPRSPWLSSWW